MKKAIKITLIVTGSLFFGGIALIALIAWLMSPAIGPEPIEQAYESKADYDEQTQADESTEVTDTAQQPTDKQDDQGGNTMPTDGVTLANFNAIETSMTYDEVVAILGVEGTLLSETEIAGVKSAMYQWDSTGLGNMNATFSDGRVISKAQFGLE